MDCAVIIVIYNARCGDSVCCKQMLRFPGVQQGRPRVLLYDNSERDMGNRAFCGRNGWTYLGGDGNRGLSRAYNAAIQYLQNAGFRGILCLLDDDTQVTDTYFRVLLEMAERLPERDIFVPVLQTDGRIVSPQVISPRQRASFFPDVQSALSYRGDDLFAFNAGMAVRSRVFEECLYDEALFLDGVDYCFLREQYARGRRPVVVDCVMQQGFSGLQRPEKTAALRRFENYARDYTHVLRGNVQGYRYLIGKRAVHLALQYRDTAFLRIYRAGLNQLKTDHKPEITS